MAYQRNAVSDAVLAELSRQALLVAADRLSLDPLELVEGLGRGRIADLILELKQARHWAYPRDRERIESLLEGIDRRLSAPASAAEMKACRSTPAAPDDHTPGTDRTTGELRRRATG